MTSTAGLAQPASLRSFDLFQHRPVTGLEQLRAGKVASSYRSLETVAQYNDELNWINETKTRNLFVGGLLQAQREYAWNGHVFGDWVESTGSDFGYANDGTLVSVVAIERTQTGWIPVSRTQYESQDGVFTQVLGQVPGDGGWLNTERTVFSLSDGLIVSGQTDIWDGAWHPTERFTLVDTDDGVVQTYQTYTGTAWANSVRQTYPDLTIAAFWETFEQLATNFSDYAGLYYGLRIPDMVEESFVDGEWVNAAKQSTVLQFGGFPLKLVQEVILGEYWDGEAWLPESRIVIDYAQQDGLDGVPASTTVQYFDGDDWADLFVERYIIQNDIQRIVQSTVTMDLGEGPAEVSRVLIQWIGLPVLADEPTETPGGFELSQNYPNPFNPSTRISYRLTESAEVRLAVYDATGRQVTLLDAGLRPAGDHDLMWSATGMPGGIYIYRLEAGGRVETRAMVLVK